MKIFAIGMNYAAHNQELHGTLKRPDEPVIFTKADSAILNQGKPFFIPDHLGRIDYETEVVVRICRLGKNIPERALDHLQGLRRLCCHRRVGAEGEVPGYPAHPLPFGYQREDRSGGLYLGYALSGG